ncbi:MAG TPA: dethiobiotin synthase [Chitinophagaceae bacterium]|nr:dethiobiotin synthase [Chitinophagaceae bacterium]
MTPIFVTGIGTDVGKTIASSVLVSALDADYWKPVQAGSLENTDRDFVKEHVTSDGQCFYEVYNLKMPASPHIAARSEGISIDLNKIVDYYQDIKKNSPLSKYLIIEGAGGIYVPLNDNEFVIGLIKRLNAKVVLVSRNYLGSINHSLLTAAICKANKIDVLGWIFNGDYLEYENEIAGWTGYPIIGKIAQLEKITKKTIYYQSVLIKKRLFELL